MVALHAGGIPGAAASIGVKALREQAGSLLGARAARRSFAGGAPRVALPGPVLPTGRLATGAGLYAEQ